MKMEVKENQNFLEYLLKNTDYSKKKIKSLWKYKNILVDGKVPLHLDFSLKKGQVIEISKAKKATKIGTIDIVYEDEKYLVVNKPSGMLTISTDKEKNRTLYHKVYEYVHQKQKPEKIFIVHRLDKETSGLVLFCKNQELRDKMQENWDQIAMKRGYVAVVKGILNKKEDQLQYFLKENRNNRVFVSLTEEGKKAVTEYKVLKEKENSLLSIEIKTGRKNQIRVSLQEIGHPIIGDTKYGGIKHKKMLLCANRLDIKDITSKKILSFQVNIPKEFLNNL